MMKFSIGEFSRITALSIKSLRLYHEKGILVPSQVDEFTNYRYYDESKYEIARTIQILKRYGFSLAEIKAVLDSCEEESDIFEFLEKKLASVQKQIQQYKEISREIEMTIMAERERAMNPELNFDVEEKELPTILIAGYRIKGKYSEIGKGFGVLGKAVGRHINGKAMMLCYDEEFQEEADFEACFPVRKGQSKDQVSVRELPGGKCVSLIHKGPYDTVGESYKKIFAYINEKNFKSLVPSREVYIKGPGMIFRGNPNNYITEIQVLIDA